MDEKQLQILWDSFAKENGGFTDYNEYKSLMSNSGARKVFFDSYNKDMGFSDYNEFESILGSGGASEVSTTGSVDTSQTSGQPLGSSAEPSLVGPNELVVGGGDTTVASVPETVQMLPVEDDSDLSAGQSIQNSFNNVLTQLEGFDEDVRLVAGQGLRSLMGDKIANEFASFTSIYNPGLNAALFGGAATAEVSVIDAVTELERLSGEMGETKGIIETIRSGDLPGFGAAVVDALSSLASTAVVSAPTAGAGLFADMGAQAISDYNKAKAERLGVTTQELYASDEADFVTPFTIGALGAGLEQIGLKGATQAILAKVSTPIMRKLAQIGIGSNKEGATEWIQNGLEAVNTAIGSGITDPTELAGVLSDALISEEGAEAYLKGFAASSSAAGLSQMAQKMTSSIRRGEVEQAAESISSIQEDLANPDLSPASRAVLEGQMDSALSRVAEVISEDAAAEANMTPEQYRQVASNMARLEDLQAVINDPAVSDATKESFVAEMDSISSEIDTIIAESETAQEQTQEMTEEAVSEGVEATEMTEEVQESTNTPEELTPQDRSVSEVEQEYETLSLDLAEERISPEQYNERAEELYREILSLRESEAAASEMEDRLFKENQERRRVEIDAAIAEFQSNNPEVTVDLFDDLPDAVVRTFDRVEAGLPTDPVALEEASSWLYDKYQSILAERDNPNRRHTTEQINAIAEQIGEDIALLENYKFNQNEAAQQESQSEGEADTVSGEAQGTETQQVEEGGQDAVQEQQTDALPSEEQAGVVPEVAKEVREQPRTEEKGQTQEVAVEAQQDTATEAQQPVAQEASPLMPDTQTVSMPVSQITTDESSFQNREGLDQSRVDDIVENFDEVKLDPIVVYNDDGKTVVLSGHHRLAAAQQMGMENIPAKIFKGTKEEAIEFARDSNTLSRAETATERAARYRDMRARGDSEATIKEKARIAHGPEATKVINLSHLSPGGKALDAINSFSKSGDTDTRNKVEAIGDWIGNVKSKHPDLSTRQENEMFDYLMEKYGTKRKSGSISSRAQFFDVANALIERAKSQGSFNEDTVLNLNNTAGKTGIELEYDRLLQEAKDAVQEARTALDNARKRAVSEGIPSERMTSLLGPLENNLRNALADEQAVRQSKGLVQDAVKAQTSIFDIIQENETEISNTPAVEQRVDDAFRAEQTTDTETTGSAQGTKRAKPKTPKTLLKGIADRLSKTGLAKSVKIMTSEEIVADLTGRSNVQFQTDPAELADIEAKAKSDGTWMKAPNGKPTNLNEKQWVLVRSKAFKDWFGDWENDPENASKVVDENGEPLVMYHSTKSSEFFEFDPEKIGSGAGINYGRGFYFESRKDEAKWYTQGEGRVIEVFLNSKNPVNYYGATEVQKERADGVSDNLSGDDVFEGGQFMVKSPNQIKSATDNVGAFDPSNPDIRFQASAWHGSPHVFDKFSTSAIGSGEGAQAFGWGLYFTDLESIARSYADSLTKTQFLSDGKEILNNDVNFYLRGGLNTKNEVVDKTVQYALEEARSDYRENPYANIKEAIELLEGMLYSEIKIKPNRNLYKATLHKGKTPDQYTWLEWDKNITTEFNDRIRKQAKKEGLLTERTGKSDIISGVVPTGAHFITEGVNGEVVYDSLVKTFGSPKEASLFLLRAGIDGVKYPAESISRGATSDTAKGSNYVVFDENAVEIEERIQFQKGEDINGYVDADGNIVINSDTAGLDTPIHEFAHIWEQVVEKDNPTLHARGMELIQTPEGKPYVDHVKRTQPGLEGNALYKEALAQAIGDSGARLVEGQQRSVIKDWLKAVWDFIATRAGISQMTPQQVANMTLREFTDAVAVDLLSGKPYVKLDNGDIVAQAPAVSEAAMTDTDKFMMDFITRMKQKNGINFQGEIDGSLSPQDFNDLITFFRYAQNKGQIDGIQGARDIAKAMGINSPAEVDMAYKLSQAQAKESTGFKKDEVSGETLKNADFAKMSDEEYRDMGRRLVESGQVNPEALVADIIREPRALQPWEVTALQYYRTQIESQISDVQDLVESGDQAAVDAFRFNVGTEAITGYKGMAAKMEVINAALFDLEVAMLATANQQSAAFRLRSLMADKDFNVVQYLAEMKARGYVDPKVEARLKELSNELNIVRAKLKRKSEQAEKLAEQIAQGNINQAAKEPERKTKKVRTKKETVDAVNMVLDSLDVSSFALPGMRFQANNTIRFQVSPNDSISAAVSDAVARMKVNVSEGNLSVSDAIEQAVADVDAAVGAGKWDSMKFRSTVANQLVQQSIPLKVKKPYVNSDGVLVVPGEYLKGLVREGSDTIDKMVEATSNELGGSFSEYDIRNAISGYGRESAGHRSDLDRKISKAKRVARLLSQVEDLETKGKRLKTAKQVHDNDTEINALKEQVRQLEYDLEMTPEERAQLQEQRYNEQRQKYLQNYIDQVQERIDNKQFAPARHQNRFEEDAETKRLRAEAEKIKNEFKKEKYRHELENRTRGQKLRALAYDVIFNITRGLSAGADFSAIGVQGAIFSFARPRDAFRVVAGSMPGTFSEANYEQYFAEMQADPFYELARKHGLNLQLPNFYQSVQEEQFKGGLPTLISDTVIGVAAKGVAKVTGRNVDSTVEFAKDKFNPFKIGDRNYSLVLSQIRLDLFKEFVTNQINKRGLDTKMDDADVKRIAEVVNTITMASKVPGLEGKTANDIVSAIMFSARKFVATWKILGGWAPLLMGPNRNPQLFYDAYGKIVGKGLGTMFLAAAIPTAIAGFMKMGQDDDEEDPYFYNPYFFDPRHSDFLKLKMGNTRVSFFQGIDGNAVFATRLATGEYMTSSSKQVRPLNGEGFNKTRLELGWDYISNKFAPTTSVAIRSLQGDRERQEAYGRFKESLYPMWLADIGDQYEDSGSVLETGSLAVMGMFGLSYNNYGGAEFAKGDGANKAKARSIFQKSGLSAYDPGEGQRSYFDGDGMAKATGKVYKDEYLPAYQKFMTEAVNSNEHKLDRSVHWEVKEGLVKKFKAEAYKYAEIKTSGIYAKGNFNKFSDDGVQYRLLQSQYKLKADYIDQYMQREAKRDRGDARREVMQKLRADGIKPTDAYRDMLIELYLYNNGSRYANERLIEDARRKKITLVKQSDYTSDMEEQEDLFDED